MGDASDLKSEARKGVPVQVRPWALSALPPKSVYCCHATTGSIGAEPRLPPAAFAAFASTAAIAAIPKPEIYAALLAGLDCWDLWQVAGSSNPLKSNFAAPAQTPLRRGFSRNIERTIRASSFWSGHNTSITPCPPPPSASQNCETAKAATELVVFLHPMLGSR